MAFQKRAERKYNCQDDHAVQGRTDKMDILEQLGPISKLPKELTHW